MISFVPVTDEDGVIAGGIRERNGDPGAAENSDPTETTGGLVEAERRKVIVASNLIFHLENVSEVLPWRNWACCSVHTVFVWVPSLLNPIPNLTFHTTKFQSKLPIKTRFSDIISKTSSTCQHLNQIQPLNLAIEDTKRQMQSMSTNLPNQLHKFSVNFSLIYKLQVYKNYREHLIARSRKHILTVINENQDSRKRKNTKRGEMARPSYCKHW